MTIKNIEERLEQIKKLLATITTGDFDEKYALQITEKDSLSVVEEGLNLMLRDLGDVFEYQRNTQRKMEAQKRELEDKLVTIEMQASAIQELSTPVMQIWEDILVMPIIGVVDTQRSADIMERLLTEVSQKQARYVIMDITGVEIVDTKTADHFIKIIKAAQLLGTNCVLTGIRPAVAQTLVEIGVDLSSIITLATLKDGLTDCLRRISLGKRKMEKIQ
ncbi:MAG: STAS domain-containing protein [Deltaproteobacteria bacterium]|nr:STAS domain-containing protein [Deltaproteobacteria bacterium]